MALALSRKHRPSTFADLVGQEHVSEPLRAALATVRTANAYLFSGPTGCGKTLTARILARSLNCVRTPTPDPCGVCPSCVALDSSGPGTLDVVDLDASLHGSVEDIRGLLDLAVLPPVESRFRVLIIDQAHMLTGLASTALLGMVEQPPDRTVFIFTTDKPNQLPSSLRSRTLHYPLRLLTPSALSVLLDRVCQREGVAVEPGVLPLVIRAGDGSARQTLSVFEQLLAGAGLAGVTDRSAAALVGDTDPILMDELIDALVIGDARSMFRAMDRAMRVNDDAWILGTNLLRRLRDLVILSSVPEAEVRELIGVSPGQLMNMKGQAALMGVAPATRTAEAIAAALAGMHGNIAHRLLLELGCARALLTLQADPSRASTQSEGSLPGLLHEVFDPPGGMPASTAPGPTATPRPQPMEAPLALDPQQALIADIRVHELRQVWPEVLDAIRLRRKSVGILMQSAELVSIDDGVIRLSVPSAAVARRLMEPATGEVIAEALDLVVGLHLPISAELTSTAT